MIEVFQKPITILYRLQLKVYSLLEMPVTKYHCYMKLPIKLELLVIMRDVSQRLSKDFVAHIFQPFSLTHRLRWWVKPSNKYNNVWEHVGALKQVRSRLKIKAVRELCYVIKGCYMSMVSKEQDVSSAQK